MTEQIDPYHRWLGIRPEEQPADHYRLLALARFEDDPEVIRDAAEQRIRHVRSYQLGQHRRLSQKILNELAAAKACLLDNARKAEYDRKLRQEVTAGEKRHPPALPPRGEPSPASSTAPLAPSVAIEVGEPAMSSNVGSRASTGHRDRKVGQPTFWRSPAGIGAAVAVGLAALVLLLWLVAPRGSNEVDGGTAEPKVPPPAPPSETVSKGKGPAPPATDTPALVFSWPVSERKDATLSIDGETKPLPQAGDESLRIPVNPGRHTVRVERSGFEPIDFANVLLVAGQTKTLRLAWQRVPQEALLVFSWPLSERVDATLRIDGQEKPLPADGDVTVRFSVSPGSHSVTVERKGFEAVVVPDIQLSDGESRDVSLAWRPIPEEPPLAVAPFDESQAKAHQETWADHLGLDVEITNSIGMRFVLIPPGQFIMGSPRSEQGRVSDEQQHRVRITKPFYLGVTEVTQGQWEAVVGTRPWSKQGADYAATLDRFDDAQPFYEQLSEKEGVTYRLPTEAEWEYACRAGTTTAYHCGNDAARLGEYAWFRDNAHGVDEKYPNRMGQKKPNAFGLYDMHGNVWEWCSDQYAPYPRSPVDDPTGPGPGSSQVYHVYRGGCWYYDAPYCRSAYRIGYVPLGRIDNKGIRVARSASGESSGPSALMQSPAISALAGGGGALGEGASFMGVHAKGTRFCIIADRSGSMVGPKLDFVKKEILETLSTMHRRGRFQLIFFNTRDLPYPQPGWRDPRIERSDVATWLQTVTAGGGTYPTPAFRVALSLSPRPDAIFFMTDGLFPVQVVDEVAELNRGGEKRVQIHAISFMDTSSEALMRKIASDSGGTYRRVSEF